MLPADALRSEARLAEAQQALNTALNGFHDASIALALTLHLDPTVMLVPQAGPLHEATLVRDDLSVDDMLAAAVGYRPDLQAARKLLDASRADQHAIVWAELGPKFQAAYANGSLAVHVTGQDDDFHAQQRSAGTVGFALGLSAQGHLKTAQAETQLATLDTVAKLDEVRAAVVTSHQACIAASKSIPLAAQQVSAAKEALQLAQDHARTGTMLAFDVLRAQTVEAQAQLSYASAIVRYNQAEVALLSTLGLLDQNTVHAGLD
jgi:outer membrane protein TolC